MTDFMHFLPEYLPGIKLSYAAFLLIGLKIIGGLYLLWLAFGAVKSSVSSPDI